jgi:GrpB-like predicted nucleotidyltransferase (UPF0157 family)
VRADDRPGGSTLRVVIDGGWKPDGREGAVVPTPVVIVEYDARWPTLYERERELMLGATGDLIVAVEHIGSTAVPNLGGKRIIDIMAGVRCLEDAERCIEPLAGIGYEYVPEYNELIPERRYFHKGPPERRTFHLHMTEHLGEFWAKHLLFRNWLRTHPEDALDYFRLKKELADRFGRDREGYTEAKTGFIESIVARARSAEMSGSDCD